MFLEFRHLNFQKLIRKKYKNILGKICFLRLKIS